MRAIVVPTHTDDSCSGITQCNLGMASAVACIRATGNEQFSQNSLLVASHADSNCHRAGQLRARCALACWPPPAGQLERG